MVRAASPYAPYAIVMVRAENLTPPIFEQKFPIRPINYQ